MPDTKLFQHTFEDQSQDGCISFDTDSTDQITISITVEESRNVWLSANRAGWRHLAKLCAELGLGNYESGYHLHKTFDFKTADGSTPEISFEIDDPR